MLKSDLFFLSDSQTTDVDKVAEQSSEKKGERTEHPRPDWHREKWMNLNGKWNFVFDDFGVGKDEAWYAGNRKFDKEINVPYPWESELSGIANTEYRGQAWYQREIELDETWLKDNQRVFIYFGAVDAKSTVYVNGTEVGNHDGGYTSFEYDITDYVTNGKNTVTVWVEDEGVYGVNTYTALIGKQGHEAPCGYTHTSGIWQSVYLESRSNTYMNYAHANPNVADSAVTYDLQVKSDTAQDVTVAFEFESKLWDEEKGEDVATGSKVSYSQKVSLAAGVNKFSLDAISIADVKLWDDVTPNLYYGTVTITDENGVVLDEVDTYFGMRQVTTESYDGREYKYICVNGEPVFLSGLLDQGFWEDGIYTAPSEEALKSDVLEMKELGFNMIRKHLKVEDPLQYYWADKLGMYIWQDMPHATAMNANGDGDETPGRTLFENTLTDMLNRDYNHPSVIAVMLFNETWGIKKPGSVASDNMTTEEWQKHLYVKTKEINPNLLVEDMSANKKDHIQPTDLNTFHMYPKGYAESKQVVSEYHDNAYVGSKHNFRDGYTQDGDPWLNSEYGGVAASNGDWDVSWCFKYQTDIQRQYEKLNGFVYTEPYDIEYERNGILTYDRRAKVFGYEEIAYGGDMTIKSLTQENYVGLDVNPIRTMNMGEEYTADAVAVNWSGGKFEDAILKWRFDATDIFGNYISTGLKGEMEVEYPAYTSERKTISFTLPEQRCVGTLTVWIENEGKMIAKNFVNVIVADSRKPEDAQELENGGFALFCKTTVNQEIGVETVDYNYEIPAGFDIADLKNMRVIAEVSSVKDETENYGIKNAAFSQTAVGSERPSDVTIWINGVEVDTVYIPDNPRDIRGTLTLAENCNDGASAGNFGYLLNIRVPSDKIKEVKKAIEKEGEIVVSYGVGREAVNANGVRVYNNITGRYAVNPTVVLNPADTVAKKSTTPSTANYTAQAVLKNGGEISVRGGAYSVTLSDGELSFGKETAKVGKGKHLVAVKLFDDHIQIYVNNNPVPVIDTYNYSKVKGNTVEVKKGSELVVAPETY